MDTHKAIRDRVSSWRTVTKGVQGLLLASILFLEYIRMFLVFSNDMLEGLKSYSNLFAGVKLMKLIKGTGCCKELQMDLDNLQDWNNALQI